MQIIPLIIQIIGGLIGSAGTGKAAPSLNLGSIGNLITGVIGGLGGGSLVGSMFGPAAIDAATATASSGDIGSMIAQLVGGGAGGAVLTGVVGAIRNMMNKA